MQPRFTDKIEQLAFESWRNNVHSQNGEDGIIAALFARMGRASGYFVEFGAWDGRHLSNCAALAEKGWAGCFIEGDLGRFADLQKNYQSNEAVSLVQAYVASKGETTLDMLLKNISAPQDIALLSIDIDGNDYHVWQALENYAPDLCVIEFNPTIPAHVLYVQEDDPAITRGSSLASLYRLAKDKGYDLVAATELNVFFLRADLCHTHGIETYLPQQVKSHLYETAIFHGYDGTVFLAGNKNLLWHGIDFEAADMQILPNNLRRFPTGQSEDYNRELNHFREVRPKQEGKTI